MKILDDETQTFIVLVNAEDQYSLWPKIKNVPDGWAVVGPEGNRSECLKFIEEVWTDMRPRTLREKMSVTQH